MKALSVPLLPTAGLVVVAFSVACSTDSTDRPTDAPVLQAPAFAPEQAPAGPGVPTTGNMPGGLSGMPGMGPGMGGTQSGFPPGPDGPNDGPGAMPPIGEPMPTPVDPIPDENMMGDAGRSGPADVNDRGMPEPGPGDGLAPRKPSAGCGKTGPQTGSASNPLNDGKPYYVKLPGNYDPNTPYRLLFVFNPTGNPIAWAENSAGYERLSAKDTAIRVYPHENPSDLSRSPGGWSGDDVASFGPLYDAVVSEFCVDEARVFATGESSGGDFASVLGCEYGDKLRAIGPCATKPVSGYPLDPNGRNCKGDVTAIVIHGANDSVVGPQNGPATRDFYTALNECGSVSEPVEGYTDRLSNCVVFTQCKEGYPVYWCQHQDPEYGNTNHGWPKFAAKMTWEIFEAY